MRLPEHRQPAQGETLARLMELRDEFVVLASHGRFHDAASREWSTLPVELRMVLVLLAGVSGVRMDAHPLQALAVRDWHEMPPAERDAIRAAVRWGAPPLARLRALAARM